MNKRPVVLSATFVKNANVPGRYGDDRSGLGLSPLANARAVAQSHDPVSGHPEALLSPA